MLHMKNTRVIHHHNTYRVRQLLSVLLAPIALWHCVIPSLFYPVVIWREQNTWVGEAEPVKQRTNCLNSVEVIHFYRLGSPISAQCGKNICLWLVKAQRSQVLLINDGSVLFKRKMTMWQWASITLKPWSKLNGIQTFIHFIYLCFSYYDMSKCAL